MKKITFHLVLFCLFFASCETSLYNKFEPIDKNDWYIKDTLTFKFKILEPDNYTIFFQTRHTKEYNYNNLWVKIIQDFPNEKMDTSYLYQTIVADPISGRWLGECTSSYCTASTPLMENISLADTGNYKLSIIQYMRTNPLEEISDVGIKVEKVTRP
jgi:gliding motility-associated lipoprotein GldH